ncbi:uncharacterized protein LOC130701519 isoform X2 [Daphnia carinata]|uniref:uncharacterized protein LOC130701519 isoform X2 n=1 Tax=Daphnia carinata TaxID=120202 RepID=UPI00286957B1|nr:uncharacterized protein LOC130701519 isoform X2 [Daphnia carinata]
MVDSDSMIPEEKDAVRFSPRHKLFIKILSFSLIVLFILAVVFQVCAILENTNYSQIGTGIWCGVVYGGTGVTGLLAVRSRQREDKAMTIGLLCMAATSVFTSLALMIIALLSLTSTIQETYSKLSIAFNAVLIGVGFMGLVVSTIMIIITAICMSPRKRASPQPISNEMHDTKKDSIDADTQQPIEQIHPPSVTTVSQHTAESHGSTDSDSIYETLKFQQSNAADETSLDVQASKLIDQFIEPIYAIPMKKKINSSSNLSVGGDFDIEVDNRQEGEENKVTSTKWFNVAPEEEPIGSDVDDSEYSRNIELPKEDVIVHPPPK